MLGSMLEVPSSLMATMQDSVEHTFYRTGSVHTKTYPVDQISYHLKLFSSCLKQRDGAVVTAVT